MKKIFLIAFFAVFLMPLNAFASAPPFPHKDKGECSYYAILRSNGNYYAVCSRDEFMYYNNDVTPYFRAPTFKWFQYDSSSAEWIFSGTISEKYYVYPSNDIVVFSNFDIKQNGGKVFFSAPLLYLMKLEEIPGILIHQAGGILSVVLMGFGIWLAVGFVPRLKSWFLRF